MIDDFKLGLSLMRYGLQFKWNIFGAVFMLVVGLSIEKSSENGMQFGYMFAMIGGLMVYQLVHSVTCAGLVQTSSKKRKLQTSASAVCLFVFALLFNTLFIVMELIFAHLRHSSMSSVVAAILMISIEMVVLLIYTGFALKMFWPSMIALIVGSGFLGVTQSLMERGIIFPNGMPSLGVAIAISYLAVVVGSLLVYLISLALYKRDFSKATFESELKRAK